MQQPLLFFDYITIICVMDIHVQTMIYDDNIQKWWYDENMWNTVNQLIEYHNIKIRMVWLLRIGESRFLIIICYQKW